MSNFSCSLCEYNTDRKNNYSRHIKSKNHLEKVVHYFYHILQYKDNFPDMRGFTLAPINKIKRHFITIDTTILYEMMKNSSFHYCK